ncbi:putative E3 ubiquitin-protein ligase RING1a-like isoform X2 [Capsicum annuum]|nr:putative E3 ubiquitin-protein ligase RING1a-like isoform X2 [Capsicum annuum]
MGRGGGDLKKKIERRVVVDFDEEERKEWEGERVDELSLLELFVPPPKMVFRWVLVGIQRTRKRSVWFWVLGGFWWCSGFGETRDKEEMEVGGTKRERKGVGECSLKLVLMAPKDPSATVQAAKAKLRMTNKSHYSIIKRTRVVMGCQHRFCRECIDKSMRLGNNECPACRIHCASRRSLRDDPGFDSLIEAIYPDVEEYEEEEFVLLEEERARNEQFQASIAKISQRQSEALIKRRRGGKDVATPSTQRTSRNFHNAYSRRKRNIHGTEPERSDPNESENDDHDENKDSPLKDERGTQTKFRKRRRRKGASTTQNSPSAASPDGGHTETAVQLPRDNPSNSPGPTLKPDNFTWGRGGTRSHNRHGSGGGSRNARNSRISKLVDYLESAKANDVELNIHLELVPFDKQTTPSLKKPHFCCTPSTSVGHLCELVAQETKSQAKDVELMVAKVSSAAIVASTINHSISMDASNVVPRAINGSNVTLERLERQDTVGGISSSCALDKNLVLVYVQKNSAV